MEYKNPQGKTLLKMHFKSFNEQALLRDVFYSDPNSYFDPR